jgi:predicted alpha-1,6-mannanase (GH76 family)
LSVDGILHERINNAEPGGDAPQFKGIFVRNLQKLHEIAPDQDYVDFIRTNADSTWEKNRGLDTDLMGVEWAGGFEASRSATSQGSALDLLIAAIVMQ